MRQPKEVVRRRFCKIGLSTANLLKIKKETLAQVFSCQFCEIIKNISYFYRTPLMTDSRELYPIVSIQRRCFDGVIEAALQRCS